MKRNLRPFVLCMCIILLFGVTVIYFLPQIKKSLVNLATSQTASTSQFQAPPSSPSSQTSSSQTNTVSSSNLQISQISPSSNMKPVHASDSQALALYEQGLKLYYQRQFPAALNLFNQALAIDPQCYEALNAKGATLAFQGKYDQGLALIQQALDINPTFVYANFNQGLAYELAGRWDQAVAAYQKALQLDNRDTWSYYGIASIYGRQGNIEKVLKYLKPAIDLEPDVKDVARDERDFQPVHQDPRFQALIKP